MSEEVVELSDIAEEIELVIEGLEKRISALSKIKRETKKSQYPTNVLFTVMENYATDLQFLKDFLSGLLGEEDDIPLNDFYIS